MKVRTPSGWALVSGHEPRTYAMFERQDGSILPLDHFVARIDREARVAYHERPAVKGTPVSPRPVKPPRFLLAEATECPNHHPASGFRWWSGRLICPVCANDRKRRRRAERKVRLTSTLIALVISASLALEGGAQAHGRWHVASVMPWYGPGFYNKRTACGQRMTRYLIGVAHRTFPCGTVIELRYNGHHRFVEVVDRGPWPDPSQYDEMPFDATARLAIHLTGKPPSTMHNVKWRRVRE